MTKRGFKRCMEDLLFDYFHDNRNKKDLPHRISIDYTRDDGTGKAYGEILFFSEKEDKVFFIKKIDYKDE